MIENFLQWNAMGWDGTRCHRMGQRVSYIAPLKLFCRGYKNNTGIGNPVISYIILITFSIKHFPKLPQLKMLCFIHHQSLADWYHVYIDFWLLMILSTFRKPTRINTIFPKYVSFKDPLCRTYHHYHFSNNVHIILS